MLTYKSKKKKLNISVCKLFQLNIRNRKNKLNLICMWINCLYNFRRKIIRSNPIVNRLLDCRMIGRKKKTVKSRCYTMKTKLVYNDKNNT